METLTTGNIRRGNLIYRLNLMTRRWRKVLDAAFREVGLTDATWRPLLHLSLLGDGVRQKDLAQSIGIEDPSLVRVLDDLAAKGLVIRAEDKSDRRAKILKLTMEGHNAVVSIRRILVPLEKTLLGGYTEEEMLLLGNLLERLETSINDFARQS
ncbi:MarR family winged helix-turn-helix transcriptional regulator [Chlorobium sp.]|jgi:MarR family transcriptional regulator, transcriptional regulator for hemolysin|uniref:MarR family winged helix-turn-helix transcriptional regulator n=1 Tax=Chlorobium sp. TaxID=1095 RepID=UPI003C69733F|nr:MarR family transcriptional regulator [Chlorobiaceae bacterium]